MGNYVICTKRPADVEQAAGVTTDGRRTLCVREEVGGKEIFPLFKFHESLF